MLGEERPEAGVVHPAPGLMGLGEECCAKVDRLLVPSVYDNPPESES